MTSTLAMAAYPPASLTTDAMAHAVDAIRDAAVHRHPLWSAIDRVPARLTSVGNFVDMTLDTLLGRRKRADMALAPTLGDVLARGLTLSDLVVREDGCRIPFTTLVDAGIVCTWAHLVALKPTLDELLGVRMSETCARERMNPKMIRDRLGSNAIAAIRAPPYSFNAMVYATTYAVLLTPAQLDALGVDLSPWMAGTGVVEALGKKARRMAALGTQDEWEGLGLVPSTLVHPSTGITDVGNIPWRSLEKRT